MEVRKSTKLEIPAFLKPDSNRDLETATLSAILYIIFFFFQSCYAGAPGNISAKKI